jgi:hypothetical protein
VRDEFMHGQHAIDKRRPPAARRLIVRARPFDLDDVGAEVGQIHSCGQTGI